MAELEPMDSPTVLAVWRAYEAANAPWDIHRLGAASAGEECERKLWYAFRWTHTPQRHEGRMLRLFKTGDIQENRVVLDLASAGITVSDRDPDTGKQWTATFVGGHVVCKLDGRLTGVLEAPATEHVLEVKSHNNINFNAIKKHGVRAKKPEHYTQMQLGMHGFALSRALYVAVCKNDDDIWTDRFDYDAPHALQTLARLERIVTAERYLPARQFEDPDAKMAFKCRSCAALAICHQKALPRRNCRTCLHATPEMDGAARWSCARHGRDLTIEGQQAGCGEHRFLPMLVPGEQIDAAEDFSAIIYRLHNGKTWIDGVPDDLSAEATP